MDRVVIYDYPIDNREEMKMKAIITKYVTGDESEHDRKVVVCESGDGYNFITGAEYFYEVGSCEPGEELGVIHICSDASVSDLQGLRRWKANKVSVRNEPAKYEVKQLSTCGIFSIK